MGYPAAVEIAHHHGIGTAAYAVILGGPKRAVAITQQDTHRVRTTVRNSQVGKAIMIKVRDGHGNRIEAHRVALGGLKSAIAIA